MTEALRRAQRKYDAENTTTITMKLNRRTDADILDRLYEEANRQGYLKRIIREDIKKKDQRRHSRACAADSYSAYMDPRR